MNKIDHRRGNEGVARSGGLRKCLRSHAVKSPLLDSMFLGPSDDQRAKTHAIVLGEIHDMHVPFSVRTNACCFIVEQVSIVMMAQGSTDHKDHCLIQALDQRKESQRKCPQRETTCACRQNWPTGSTPPSMRPWTRPWTRPVPASRQAPESAEPYS